MLKSSNCWTVFIHWRWWRRAGGGVSSRQRCVPAPTPSYKGKERANQRWSPKIHKRSKDGQLQKGWMAPAGMATVYCSVEAGGARVEEEQRVSRERGGKETTRAEGAVTIWLKSAVLGRNTLLVTPLLYSVTNNVTLCFFDTVRLCHDFAVPDESQPNLHNRRGIAGCKHESGRTVEALRHDPMF